MSTGFNDDQVQFQEVVGRFLADKSPPSAVRTLMDSESGYDQDVWRQLSGEVGLAGTHLPETYGGFGFGPVELGIVSREMGRYLYCGPYFASAVMASYALLNAAAEDHKQRLLPEMAAGTTIAALVLDNLSDVALVGQQVRAQGEVLSGVARTVVDAHVADVLIVAAGTNAGVALYEVAPKDVEIVVQRALDPTRKLASVRFSDTPARALCAAGEAQLPLLWDQMCVALANEMVGGADHLFTTTIDYMKMRVQFGRTIGSFQALKHRCADLLLELELAKAMAEEASFYLASGEGDAFAANTAKAMASDAYMSVARQAIQLRGGIGFTWEEDTHLWFKRAKASEVFLGTSNWHREQMIQRMEADHVAA
ncbi:MAG: acyl-CoA dehydrogenase family protein [Pseudomonadota bacterium]